MVEKEAKQLTHKFTVEFGDDKFSNFAIGALQLRVRGEFSKTRWHSREQGAPDLGQTVGSIPDIPGQRLEVDCRHLTGRIYDPLGTSEGEKLLDQYKRIARDNPALPNDVGPAPDVPLEFTPDLLVTLLHELVRMLNARKLKVIKGSIPTIDEIDSSGGERLFDMWNTSAMKPRYARDAEEYARKVDQGAH